MIHPIQLLPGRTLKKYMDGLLEEVGIKDLGSQTGKALKHIFQKAFEIEAAYYKRFKEKIDPIYCPPLNLDLRLGGSNDLTNPPWNLKFIFTRELGEYFDHALECVSPVVSDFGVMRDRLMRELLIKIGNPDRYYGRALENAVTTIEQEFRESVVMSSGVFLFDVPERTWVRTHANVGAWSPTESLKNWVSMADKERSSG